MDGGNPVRPLGTLVTVDPRTIWAHEAHHFTPWLAGEAERLGEALGIDIEIEAQEHQVGTFSLDLIGRDVTNDAKLIIENQLEGSDHTHLGQLLTYAAGTDARTIVWIATSFRDEHRQAITWVNDWQKALKATSSAAAGSKGALYADFWERYLETVKATHSNWSQASGSANNWLPMSKGIPAGYTITASFTGKGQLQHELYIDLGEAALNKSTFDALHERKADFEAVYGRPLDWQRLDNRRACRVADHLEGLVADRSLHDDFIKWFVDCGVRMRTAIAEVGLPPYTSP